MQNMEYPQAQARVFLELQGKSDSMFCLYSGECSASNRHIQDRTAMLRTGLVWPAWKTNPLTPFNSILHVPTYFGESLPLSFSKSDPLKSHINIH